uniref:Fibroblast growth factor n=1 Tax=Oncorhynchus tshawytscha TaxID=74940 RepID=A0AAZ3NXW8_ONCTS
MGLSRVAEMKIKMLFRIAYRHICNGCRWWKKERTKVQRDILKVKAVSAGVVAIKGHETGRYLAMDKDGHLYGSKTLKDECYFLEKMEENHYNTYRSQKYQAKDWFLGLKRNGQPKAGQRTHIGQKAIYFLPRPVDNTTM